MSLVISAFPGCGKSTICKNAEQYGLINADVHYDDQEGVVISLPHSDTLVPVFDSDSSIFPKDKFPQNYIEHIKSVTEQYPDSVIMVSSHDNVREAMREAGIDYTLVYPQRELKGDYLERYKERGSPDQFVNMMDHKWNDFVDSSESDPTTDKLVLGEGEFLVDKVADKISQITKADIAGNENMNDAPIIIDPIEVTAAIIDVNADANNPDVIQPEVTGDVVVGVVNEPEGTAASTLTAEALEGGAIAVDASTPDDPAMGVEEPDRSELVEATIDMGKDIEVLEEVITRRSEPDVDGLESLQDGGTLFVDAAENIKKRYGIDVEPTLAGFESFLDTLKKVFTKTSEDLKEIPTKQDKAVIKKYLYENEKAASLYTDSKWQDEQKFINVGKVKLQVPSFLSAVDSPAAVKAILDMVNQRIKTSFTKYYKNSESRTVSGIKIFNSLKGKSPEDGVKLLDPMLPITPAELKGAVSEAGLSDLDTKSQSAELPVLNKDKIKEVVDIMNSITELVVYFNHTEESGLDKFIDDEDWNRSKYWDSIDETKQAKQVWDVVTFYGDTPEFILLTRTYSEKMLPVAKFLEQWILNSVK